MRILKRMTQSRRLNRSSERHLFFLFKLSALISLLVVTSHESRSSFFFLFLSVGGGSETLRVTRQVQSPELANYFFKESVLIRTFHAIGNN